MPNTCIKYAKPFWTPLRLENPSVLHIPSRTCLPAYGLTPGAPLFPTSFCFHLYAVFIRFALYLNLQMKSPSIRFLICAFRLHDHLNFAAMRTQSMAEGRLAAAQSSAPGLCLRVYKAEGYLSTDTLATHKLSHDLCRAHLMIRCGPQALNRPHRLTRRSLRRNFHDPPTG